MANTLLTRLAALSGQDVPAPADRAAELAAIRGIFDGYFARLDAAMAGAGLTPAREHACQELEAAVAVFAEEAQATLRAIEQDPDFQAWVAAHNGGQTT